MLEEINARLPKGNLLARNGHLEKECWGFN